VSDSFEVVTTPEWDALHEFDAKNNVEPPRTIAERIAAEFFIEETHSIVDAISGAIEDAMALGARRGPFEEAAKGSYAKRKA
jgi:hypothetical protein